MMRGEEVFFIIIWGGDEESGYFYHVRRKGTVILNYVGRRSSFDVWKRYGERVFLLFGEERGGLWGGEAVFC